MCQSLDHIYNIVQLRSYNSVIGARFILTLYYVILPNSPYISAGIISWDQ